MNYHIEIIPHTLDFKRPAGTSRGVYTKRNVWYLRLTSPDMPGRVGIGECAPLPDLSCDALPGKYMEVLSNVCKQVEKTVHDATGKFRSDAWAMYPSIAFGLQTAFRHLHAGTLAFEDTGFAQGHCGIPINGLIWMGDRRYMFEQIKKKIEVGFRCIKLKIGAIDFEEELSLLRYIRSQFTADEIELRVDANGAFAPSTALEKLQRLSELQLHSIEQPIRAGQWDELARLVSQTPLPIALDEELIGSNDEASQRSLLEHIHPHYLVIKPSLHALADRWIALAREMGIGWWVTSALESNIGLNAIAQWVSPYLQAEPDNQLPQGLGTGLLFCENIEVPLTIRKDELWYEPTLEQNPEFPAGWG
ncbi:MAG: o-succinylbenzoate synthase [Bacteroides sp.]|nr:o-succinylbenzoate synthase [Bacteroides sp.]